MSGQQEIVSSCKRWQKGLVWALIAALSNPLFTLPLTMYASPAMARDTDIYLSSAYSGTTAEPAIMLILDTSDSMNLPEGWREYPGAYDSHVEYLWNDRNILCGNGTSATTASGCTEVTAEDPNKVSTAAYPTYPSSIYGTWAGNTLTDRQALWTAAKNSAFSTQTGDPGPAYTWRNYNDLSWIYWLPAGADETDLRLTSPAWNRFRGYVQQIGGNTSDHLGGAGSSGQRGGLAFMDTNDYRSYNACNASLVDLTPSTVMAPSAYDRNTGKSLNQQLDRWDPYMTVTSLGNSGYPGGSDQQTTGYARGYLDESATPTGSPSNNPVYRDDDGSGTSPKGSKGLPIRYADSTSGAGWSNVRADLGGYIFFNEVDGYTDKTMLDTIASWYGLATTTDVDSSGTITIADSKFIAWKGNRDVSAAFGSKTGVHAYYDISAGTGTAGGTCSATTGPAGATCIGQTSGGTPAFTLTATASCNVLSAGTNESDATNPSGTTLNRGKTCSLGTISYSTDQNGSAYPNNADVAALLSCAPANANYTIKTTDYYGCTPSGGTTTVNPCTLVGATTYTIGACGLGGGTNVSVGTCALSGQTTQTVGTCAWSGRSTYTEGTCAWSGRLSGHIEGLGYYAYGGSCQQNGSTTGCQVSGLTTIGGNANASGYYTTAAAATASATGCSNSVAAGTTYNYGGTCTESGSAASCSISGGSTVTINGTTYNNVNGSCSNSLAAGTYKVGGTCMENSSTASCSTTAGSSVTIRGTTYTGVNRTCSNTVTAGTYKYGQTCSGTNNVCTLGATTSKTIRGTTNNFNSGPGITTSTCTGTAGQTITYNGTSCSSTGSGVANCCTYNAGSTLTNPVPGGSPSSFPHVGASCTAAITAGTYNTGTCTGNIRTLSATVGGGVTTQTGQASACNMGTSTFAACGSLGGTSYISSCTDKTDLTTDCNTRYGAYCTTGCTGNGSKSISGAATSGTTVYYRVFNRQAHSDYLYHSCKADETTTKFMRNPSATPLRPLGQPYSTTASNSSTTAAYTDSSANQIANDPTHYATMYSVNYLNWKFGPKGPNGAPIGRKTRLQIAKDALSALVQSNDGVRFGLIVFNKTDTTGVDQGGNVVYPITRMGANSGDPDYVNRAALISKINAVVASSRTPLTETMYEAFLYFTGGTPRYGTLSTTAYGGAGVVSAGRDTSSNTIGSNGKYVSPMLANPNTTSPAPCQNNYIVMISDGGPEDDTDADSLIQGLSQSALPPVMMSPVATRQDTLSTQFEVSSNVPYGPTDLNTPSSYVWLDELTYFMANGDMSAYLPSDPFATSKQSINTYTIGFAGANSPVLQNAAAVGHGHYYQADDSSALSAALAATISSIRDWTPTGSAPAVPVSSYNRSQNDNNVYLAFFGPDVTKSWNGTLKKYMVSTSATECGVDYYNRQLDQCLIGQTTFSSGLKNVDQYIAPTQTGLKPQVKVNDAAVSFWSDTANPDGGKPNMGGTGYVLKTSSGLNPSSRKVYTHITGETDTNLTHATNSVSENNPGITKTLLGNASMTNAAQAGLINFARGGDYNACQSTTATCTSWRAWPHHDILHSQPVALTYQTSPTLKQYLFYMSNDGLMHAIDTSNGQEKWSFMVEEAFPKLSEMQTNLIGEHTIGGDGSPVIYAPNIMDSTGKLNASGKAYLVFGLRRGGHAYYALDISQPDNPQFLWKIDNTTTGFSELGETWSTPSLVNMRLGGTDPVAVFGAGYDPVPNDMLAAGITRSGTTATVLTSVDHGYATGDQVVVSGATQTEYNGTKTITVVGARTFTFTIAATATSPATGVVKVVNKKADSMGRGVFFVNARTGALIRSFTNAAGSATNIQPSTSMDYSMPSDAVALNVDQNGLGYVNRLYMGDMGGNVWRFSENAASTNGWDVIKFANLSDLSSTAPKRKIFFRPAVVSQNVNGEAYDAVFVGTGDRENPFRTDVQDKFFMIKDRYQSLISSQSASIDYSAGNFVDVTSSTITSGLTTAADGSISYASYDTALKSALQGSAVPGWVLPLTAGSTSTANGGEKVINPPTVYFNTLRFGTWSPIAQASPCIPPGEGFLYSFNSTTGGFADLNSNGVLTVSEQSRINADYQTTGFISPGVVGIFGGGSTGGTSGGGQTCSGPDCTCTGGTCSCTGPNCTYTTPPKSPCISYVVCVNGTCTLQCIGKANFGQDTYWYQEPEQ